MPAYDKEAKDAYGRKRLLARMAGNIAAGVYPTTAGYSADQNAKEARVVEISVSLAEKILRAVGL